MSTSKKKMKNKILAATKRSIPYVKDLNNITGSALASILMQQLDYWFDVNNSKSFYKFLEPCLNVRYKEGDSWLEELGFSKEEFRTAFDKIGIRYKSKTDFLSKSDPFDGKYYCSYYDRVKGLTFYFRNHDIVDIAIENAINNPGKLGKPISQKSVIPISGNRESQFPDVGNPNFQYITESTTENTHESTFSLPNGKGKKNSSEGFSNFPREEVELDQMEKMNNFMQRVHIYGSGPRSKKDKERAALLEKWINLYTLENVLKAFDTVEAQMSIGMCSSSVTSNYVLQAIMKEVPDTAINVSRNEMDCIVYECKCGHLFLLNDEMKKCNICGSEICWDLVYDFTKGDGIVNG